MPAPIDPTDPFRALADPTRREIVDLLANGPLPVRVIAGRFPDISRPAVSKHLRLLRVAGVVSEEKSGRERFYRLEHDPLAGALDWLADLGLAGSKRRERSATSRSAKRRRPAASRSAAPKPTEKRRAEAKPAPKKPAPKKRAPKPAAKPKKRAKSSSQVQPAQDDWKAW